MSKNKFNKSKTYLLPLLAEIVPINKNTIGYIKNTYMNDFDNKYPKCLFLKLECDFKNPEFTKYEHELSKNELFVDSIDFDNNESIYIFKFPDEYLVEYNYLFMSKYSKFGEDAKKLILEFWTNIYGTAGFADRFLIKVKRILYKEEKLRLEIEEKLSSRNHPVVIDKNAELGDYVDYENETIKLIYESKTT